MIVVDAGVWVHGLIDNGPQGRAARSVLSSDPDWVAPSHAPIEVLRTIRRYETAGLLTALDGDTVAAEVFDATVTFVGPEPWLLRFVWRHRHNLSSYDAPYAALALHHGISLVTFDISLARAAAAVGAEVIIPGAS